MTSRLLEYLPTVLWFSSSLRSLALHTGASPSLLRNLLISIASESQQSALRPTNLGIHELKAGRQTHFLASNLDIGTVVAFFAEGESQLERLCQFIAGAHDSAPINEVTAPAVPSIARLITERCATAQIYCSINSIIYHISGLLASSALIWTRKGKPGSVSAKQANEIFRLRATELSIDHQQQLYRGLERQDPFWMSFNKKETLIELLRNETANEWTDSVTHWFRNLPADLQVVFVSAIAWTGEIQRFDLALARHSHLDRFEGNLRNLESLLNKPGKRFSAEMISVLLSAGTFLAVPIRREEGTKGIGPLWLEEEKKMVDSTQAMHAGISLESLVGLLSTIWQRTQGNHSI